MQKLYRASLGFKSQKAAKKPAFGTNVINSLSILITKEKILNSSFSNLPVPLKELQAINENLSAALVTALAGNQLDLKVAVIQWDAAFTLTANYVSHLANGDENIINNAGFTSTKNETVATAKALADTKFKAAVNGYAYSVS